MNEYQVKSLQLIDEMFANMDGEEFLKKYREIEKYIGPTIEEFMQMNGFPQVQKQQIKEIREAITEYYLALDRRQHGGVAQDKAFAKIERILGMHWVQGEATKQLEIDANQAESDTIDEN